MSKLKSRMETMLFDYKTTNRTDYQYEPLVPCDPTTFKSKPTCAMRRPPPLKDIHTMTEWKTEHLPFDLLHEKRPIVGTNPRQVQQPYTKPVDEKREEIQKTRPRVIITPAVRMDDIEDPKSRSILVNEMYTTASMRGLLEGVPELFNVTSPYPGADAPSQPIYLEKWKPGLVSPEWRLDSLFWDLRQLRGHCDVTKTFWLEKKMKSCQSCAETEQVNNYRKMQRKMRARRP